MYKTTKWSSWKWHIFKEDTLKQKLKTASNFSLSNIFQNARLQRNLLMAVTPSKQSCESQRKEGNFN